MEVVKGEESSSKISINEGLKRVYKSLYEEGEGEWENIQFPDAYAYSEGSDEYTLIEDDFVTLMENFAKGSLNVFPLYKNPPYESESKYEVKDSDKTCLLRSPSERALYNPYMFFLTTIPADEVEDGIYYNTDGVPVYTESGIEHYYTLSIWEKTA